MRTAALLVLALLLSAGAAGCLQGESTTKEGADAPLTSKQLRVGPSLLGEYVRIAVNSSGHRRHTDWDGQTATTTVKPFEDHDYFERRIAEISGQDRYWKTFPGIQYQKRLTDIDPEGGEIAIINQQTTYRQSDRLGVYDDLQATFPSSHMSCSQTGCTTETVYTDIDFRSYHANPAPVDALSLADKVLTLGRQTSLNLTWTDQNGLIHKQWANHTAKREVIVNGERTFLIESKFESRIVNQPPTEKAKVGQTEPSASPTKETQATKIEVPKPVRATYMSARLSLPVRQVVNLAWEHEGKIYWTNTTQEVEVYEPGAARVIWGNESQAPPAAVGTLTMKELRSSFGFKELQYPFSTAWKNMAADPTLSEFKRITTANPDLVPTLAQYAPDASRNANTWSVYVSDDAGKGAFVEARQNGIPGAGASVPQERESQRSSYVRSIAPERAAAMRFVGADATYATFRAIRPGTWQPAIQVTVGEYGGRDSMSPMVLASIVYGNPSSSRQALPSQPMAGEFVFSRDTIVFSLLDGGLTGINITGVLQLNSPLMAPFGVPIPPSQAADRDMEARRLEDAAWFGP